MTTAATSLLGLALPVTGELSGTWGDTVNNSITSLLDTAIAGTTTLSTDADVTLTTTTLASNQARQAILLCSGARTGIKTITAPAQSKIYTVINSTTGGYAVKIVGVGPTTGVTIGSGQSAQVAWNGSDFVQVGASAGGSNTQVQYNNNGALAGSANLTFDGTNLGVGAAWTTNPLRSTQPQFFQYGAAVSTLTVASDGPSTLQAVRFSNSVASSTLSLGKGRGTYASPSAVATGDFLGVINFQGYGGTTARTLVQMNGVVDTYTSDTNISSYLTFGVSPSGAAAATEGMRLTSTGLGIGTSSPGTKLEVTGDITGTWATGATRFVGSQYLTGSSYQLGMKTTMDTRETQIFAKAADTGGYVTIATGTTPSERVRVDGSGNVGIGTSSPAYKLDAQTTATGTAAGDNTVGYFGSLASGRDANIRFGDSVNASARIGYLSGSLYMYTSGAERMRLDTSGNLGLGVTPSAWYSNRKAIQVSNGVTISGSLSSADYGFIGTNYYDNASAVATYIGSGKAAKYEQSAGVHAWYVTNTSGTAGNAITFTQAMTLDASGNLGIGETSPTYALVVNRNTAGQIINLIGSGGSGKSMGLGADSTGGYIQQNGANPFYFYINGAERARIDSSGNLLVGTTSVSAFNERLNATQPTGGRLALYIANTASSDPYGGAIYFTGASPNNSTNYFLKGTDSGPTNRFLLLSNGGLSNYQANNTNLSDRREKTNFAPAGDYLAKICAIPVQTFNYIDQNMEDDPGLTLGVVAQDVEAVAPELVMESNWAKEGEEPKMRLSIYQTDLQYALMKCIQEQQALITQLTARITALEAK